MIHVIIVEGGLDECILVATPEIQDKGQSYCKEGGGRAAKPLWSLFSVHLMA